MLTEEQTKEIKKGRLVSFLMYIVAPVIYIIIAFFIQEPKVTAGPNDLVVYLLLGIAVIEPTLYPIIERFQIAGFRKASTSALTPAKLLTTLVIIKAALVNAVYIYGIVAYLITADFNRIYLFYIIGAFWSIFYWPRQDKLEAKLQELELIC